MTATAAPQEITLTRVFDAPRELVFRAWTDPSILAKWWGPNGFTNPRCEADARPGGAIHIDMRGPDGTVYPMIGTFKEVVPPQRLSFLNSPVDDAGKQLLEVLTVVTFAEEGGKTTVTVQARVIKSTPIGDGMAAGMPEGWRQSLDRLFVVVSSN